MFVVLFWIVAVALAAFCVGWFSGWKRLVAALVFVVFCICFGVASGFLHGFPWT